MNVFLLDALDPERKLDAQDHAMLQALYSRSPLSVVDHVARAHSGSARFMETYYTGYGHDSIGDCGTCVLFIEEVSLLAAKAIEDSRLFNGQESSTRYLDFSTRPITVPDVEGANDLAESMRALYMRVHAAVLDKLRVQHPGDGSARHDRAINARAFDVARGFLPAGSTTQLSWGSTITHMRDRLRLLREHPLQEVRDFAVAAWETLSDRYPQSFPPSVFTGKSAEALEAYLKTVARHTSYFLSNFGKEAWPEYDFDTSGMSARIDTWRVLAGMLTRPDGRPRCAKLPPAFDYCGTATVQALLDFGSFRDLHRHRGGGCPMPLLTTAYGVHPWYMEQLPDGVYEDALRVLGNVEAFHARYADDPSLHPELQYLVPLGYRVPVHLAYGLPQLVYVAELRSSATVHPTLRRLAMRIGDSLHSLYPDLYLHLDRSEDGLCLRRGSQTIHDSSGSAVNESQS